MESMGCRAIVPGAASSAGQASSLRPLTPELGARGNGSIAMISSHPRRGSLLVRMQAEPFGGFFKRLVLSEPQVAIPSPAPAAAAADKAPQPAKAENGAPAEAVERSYVMVKPDGVQRGLVGEIISRFERKGFVLRGLKLFQCPQELAEEHYKDLKDKPFYPKLVEYIISGPVVAIALEGKGVVASARKLIGATNPLAAEPGTIRGDFAVEVGRNVVHGSDSIENGTREIGLWFKEGEICDWEPITTPWLRE